MRIPAVADDQLGWLLGPFGDPPDGAFELALVLGGTVSAGAYTAGVMDFLIEALDGWDAVRGSAGVPAHRVTLKVIAGTSGGGVIAATAARALACRFSPVRTPAESDTGNPFFEVWTNRLTLDAFLDTTDIKGGRFASLFDGRPIDLGARYIAQFTGDGPLTRPWVADPLRVVLTATNLRGIPYRADFGDGLGQTYVDHADYAKFAVGYAATPKPNPDEFGLVAGTLPPSGLHPVDWDGFSLFARATAAFPAGFPPRVLARPLEHYRYRVTVVPGGPVPGASPQPGRPAAQLPSVARLLVPDWDALRPVRPDGSAGPLPETYQFLAVDGGATDNEPIELARVALAGVYGRSARDADTAKRAVLLVDPFAGSAELGPDGGPPPPGTAAPAPLPEALLALAGTWKQQARYASQDLQLAADDTVFSRFMLTPTRDGVDAAGQPKRFTGGAAIASAGLGAFIGFACRDFMVHDYFLGRRNAQAFLRRTFVLGAGNPIVRDGWRGVDPPPSCPPGFLPLVPLLGTAAEPVPEVDWPAGKLDPEVFRSAIEARFKAIVNYEGDAGVRLRTLAWIGGRLTAGKAADAAIDRMQAYLRSARL